MNSIIGKYHEAVAELKNMRGMVDAGGGVVGQMKRELAIGCPKKTISPNFVSQRNPLVFIG